MGPQTNDQLDILKAIFDRGAAINQLWGIYMAVCFGLLGVFTTGKAFTDKLSIKLIVSVGFVVFAMGNLSALCDTWQERKSMIDHLLTEHYAEMKGDLSGEHMWWLIGYHLLMDALFVLCICKVHWSAPAKGKTKRSGGFFAGLLQVFRMVKP